LAPVVIHEDRLNFVITRRPTPWHSLA